MKIMVSACLLGENVKYNGGNNYSEELHEYLKGHEVFSVCPEVMGGLPVPRIPCERVYGRVEFKPENPEDLRKNHNGTVFNKVGENKDKEFHDGAELALKMVSENEIECVILQPRSPSCGIGTIYDGTFSGKKTPGNGVFSEILQNYGFKLYESKGKYDILIRE